MKRPLLAVALALTPWLLPGSDVNLVPVGCPNQPGAPVLAIPVRVMSPKLQVVEGLQAKDFVVTENGVPRQVCGFAHVRQPVSVGILLDTSGSMRGSANNLLAIARVGINQFLDSSGPQDEYFLKYVNTGPAMKCVFHCDLRHIRAGLQVNPKGRTALIDGIYLALNGMRHAHHINRCLLVVSDGGENESVYNDKELARAIADFPVPVFAVIPLDSGIHRILPTSEEFFNLVRFANNSGGYAAKVADEKGILAAMTQLATAMRTPYILSLTGAPPSAATRSSRIRVAVKGVPGHPLVFCKSLFTTAR